MPITVQGPNGVTIDFPDGTDPAMIDGVMRQAVGGTAPSAPAATPQSQPYTGSLLPFSRDARGNVYFDSDAGLLGAIKRTFTLPHDVMTGAAPLPSSTGEVPGSVGPYDPRGAETMARVREAETLLTPVNPAIRAGEAAMPGLTGMTRRPKPPTATELKDAAAAGYDRARGMGVDIKGSAVGDLARQMRADLEQDGVFAELAPQTFSIIGKISNPPEGAVATIANLEAVRRSLGHAAKSFTNPTEQFAAARAIERLDGFLSGLPKASVVAGPAAAAREALTAARGNYAAAQRSNKITGELDNAITGAVERGNLAAAVANSGANVDNAIRQRMAAILKSPKEARGYTPEELAGMERVARGTVPTNVARVVGNLLGGGGGLGAVVTGGAGAMAGASTGSPMAAAAGAALPAVGLLSKQIANMLTRKSAAKVDELIRSRSPLAESRPSIPVSPEMRSALIRALTTTGAELSDEKRRRALIDALAGSL